MRLVYIAIIVLVALTACGGEPAAPVPLDAAEDLASVDQPPSPPDVPAPLDGALLDGTDVSIDVSLDVPDVGDTFVADASGGCTSDTGCVGSPGGPVCDTAAGRCVACTPSDDRCPTGQRCVTGPNRCVMGCRDDMSCGAPGDGGVGTRRCDPGTHACVDCLRDEHCAPGALCVGNTCVSGCSGTRPCPSGQTCCGGACADTQTNTASCGGCDRRCSLPNAVPVCRSGACGLGSCMAPFGNCDGDASNGCETDTSGSTAHCGACGAPCGARANSSATCTMGTCAYTCSAGFGDCDGNAANGCEANLATTPSNCGMCGRACSLTNATAGCTLGACSVTSCATGFGNCNGNAADGCEVDVRGSVANCGACGRVCALANATPICSAGTCAIDTCNAGFGNCDGNPANGCEGSLSAPTSCGMCGRTCPTPTGPHTVPRCSASGASFTCGIACEAGYLDCDSNLANGCEATGSCTVDRELFYDGFESGAGRWSLDPVWLLTGTSFYTPCAGDRQLIAERRDLSLPAVYGGNATLTSPIDISRAVTLTLTNQDRSGVAAGDALTIQVSVDGSGSWTTVADSRQGATCGVQTVDLSAFVGHSSMLLRFSYSSVMRYASTVWYLDEVRVRALVRNY